MQKVITINLNGQAYQLDEDAYEALRAYLARAGHELQGNPDRVEIMADIEQAIADKCQAYLRPHKNVVTATEVAQIIADMGPVDGVGEESGSTSGASSAASGAAAGGQGRGPRRLYRVTEGAMVAGVCNGLAAYFRIDVTIVRVAFALMAFVTSGIGIFAYVIMMFVVPEARTPEERAAAGGTPFNAKDVVDRIKQQYAEGSREWRRQWRQQQRQWRRGWGPGARIAYGPPAFVAVLLPVFALAQVGLFLLAAAALISLVNTGGILHWQLPPNVPLWAGVLILLIGYQIVASPFRAAQHWRHAPGIEPGWLAFWNAVVWLTGLAFVIWIASNHVPEIREFVQRMPEILRDFAEALRAFVARERPAG
jgi:phage shock protein PspC (stress-responsive transcriptional regulator)